jgi:hypothetical protein
MKHLLAVVILPLFAGAPAFADIYTWVEKDGTTHVSNLAPPQDARVLRVSRTAPPDPERDAALREATRQAEVRALDERLRQVSMELEESRRQPPPPPVVVIAPPPPAYYAPPPAPTIVNVVTPQGPSGCDYGWGDCGFGLWPYYAVTYPSYPGNTWFGRGGKHPRKGPMPHSYTTRYNHLIPPLVPPPPMRHGGRKG